MKKYIMILGILAIVSGAIGFSTDFAATSILRVFSLIAADLAVILMLGKFVFFSEKCKVIRQRIRVR